MAQRTGSASLPLHGGRAPGWLFDRMKQLAPAIVEAIVIDHGPAAVLERLSDSAVASEQTAQQVLNLVAGESAQTRTAATQFATEQP